MADMTKTIAPKSDQMNADDLIGGPMTIKITKVSLLAGDQPVAINFEGDNGKPYKPCKSMRRVLVQVWGGDGNTYVGRSMTLYRDDKVAFGGAAVGGIRISHMSDIKEAVTMALTATRASRKPYTVKPLTAAQAPKQTAAAQPAAAAALPEPTPEKPYALTASSRERFLFATTQEWREKAFEVIESYASVTQCQGFVRANEGAFQIVQQTDGESFDEVMAAIVDKETALKSAA